MKTTIPAADTKQPSGTRVFTMEYGYDRGLGRMKAMRYPGAVNQGEMVALEYDTHGYPLGETALNAYDDLGNLTSKSDYGSTYLYGTPARTIGMAGPHAVRQVAKSLGGTATFTYDANGNLVDGDGRQIDFDLMDRPVRVVMAGTTTDFAYGPGGGRYRQKVTGAPGTGFGPKTVYYVDKEYELTVWDTGSASAGALEERSFIGGSVVVLSSQSAAGVTTREVRYQHVDRLGSPEAATRDDAAATLMEAHGFDPWGKPRDGSWLPSGERLHPGGEPGTTSTRGFTGHEQLDASYLTHMNGRMYDYRLGRFLSVDPIISNPANSQSINPYSYIGNNPLSGTDPTGYQAKADDEQSHGNRPVGKSPGGEQASILGKMRDAFNSGLVTAKTSMAEVAEKIGVGMDAIAKAFPDAVAKITGGSGGRTTTTQAAGPVQEAGAPRQVASGQAQPTFGAKVTADAAQGSAPTSNGVTSKLDGAARAVFQADGPLKYLDLNFSWGRIYGVSAGVILNAEGSSFQLYAGPAIAVGASMSLTGSSQSPTQGWNIAGQVNFGLAGEAGGAYQKGLDPQGRIFTEVGGAYGTGASISGTWISPSIAVPASKWPSALGDLIVPWTNAEGR